MPQQNLPGISSRTPKNANLTWVLVAEPLPRNIYHLANPGGGDDRPQARGCFVQIRKEKLKKNKTVQRQTLSAFLKCFNSLQITP